MDRLRRGGGAARAVRLHLGYLLYEGVGIWDNNNAVVWALDIASYDWWIGVACGSLLVSGILLLLGAEWRGAVNRVAETVALLATAAAGLYPIIHLGRPWFFYWNLPYPNTFGLWPQFRSPLLWDAIDIVSFLVVALSLWYIGLLPDLACLRDRAHAEAARRIEAVDPNRRIALFRARAYGLLASGWRGSAAHWQIWGQAYRVVALLGVLLVVSVQTGASVMLAGSVMPGWHGTLMPISFLIHAVLSGVGVTASLVVLVRGIYGLDGLVTARHLDALARLMLCLGCASAYCYAAEFFDTALTGDAAGRAVLWRRMEGGHALAFWVAVLGLVLPPQLFWSARARRSPLALAAAGILVAAGAYADHVMILVVTLTQDFLPSSRLPYGVDLWGIATFAGSLGLFLCLVLLFARYLPVVSITETRRLVPAETTGEVAPLRPGREGSAAEGGAPCGAWPPPSRARPNSLPRCSLSPPCAERSASTATGRCRCPGRSGRSTSSSARSCPMRSPGRWGAGRPSTGCASTPPPTTTCS